MIILLEYYLLIFLKIVSTSFVCVQANITWNIISDQNEDTDDLLELKASESERNNDDM